MSILQVAMLFTLQPRQLFNAVYLFYLGLLDTNYHSGKHNRFQKQRWLFILAGIMLLLIIFFIY